MRFFLLISLFSLNTYAMFSSNTCVQSEFTAETKKEGAFWGALSREFKVTKSRCKLTVVHNDVLSSEWEFDICKEPINLKVEQYFTKKHYIKEENCTKKSKSTFCRKSYEVLALIDKEGLVLAEGERDTLETEHGKIYCLSLLLDKYLMSGDVFSMNESQRIALFDNDVSVDRSKPIGTIVTPSEIKSPEVKKEMKSLKETVQQTIQTEAPDKQTEPAKVEVDNSGDGEKLESF